MRLFSLICLFNLISVLMFGQNKLKTDFEYKVTYKLTAALDSTDLENKESEVMVLLLSKKLSSYSSRAKLVKNKFAIKGNSGQTKREALTKYPYIILKNREQDSLYYTLQIVEDFFYFKQTTNLFNWELKNDIKKIGSYTAQKAITNFSGRQYVAWFTPEIPISDGPYKFNGLPGLILEISDSEKQHTFEFLALEKLQSKEPFNINLKQYIKTSRSELFEVYERYRRDPFTYVNNPNITISKEVHQNYIKLFAETLAKENNRLEKE